VLPRSRHCGGHAEGQRPLRQHCVLGHQPQSRAAHPGGVCRRRVLAGVEEQHQGRSQLRAAGRRGGRMACRQSPSQMHPLHACRRCWKSMLDPGCAGRTKMWHVISVLEWLKQ